jgi:NH3-dependent NAD+ synthetase
MLRTVEETAIQLGVSKTTIYNKLKMKEYKSKLVKKQGKSMIDDSLFNLIQDGLKVQNEVENKEIENDVNSETSIDEDGLLNLNKELIDNLLEQLKEKDKQISELHRLIENNQILLKEEQKKSEQQLYLAEHFEEVDNKLQDLREKMEQKRNEKIKLFKIFSK